MARPASSLQPDCYERQSIDYLDDFDHVQHGDNVLVFWVEVPETHPLAYGSGVLDNRFDKIANYGDIGCQER
jgi:hypothetical protein